MKTEKIHEALDALKLPARELQTEKPRALTGLIGELSACRLLNLNWEPSDGHDAIDRSGKKVQIKSRRDSKGGQVNPLGTISGFTNFDFDYALYVELDSAHEVDAIYSLELDCLRSLITRKDNALPVGVFRRYGVRVFQETRV